MDDPTENYIAEHPTESADADSKLQQRTPGMKKIPVVELFGPTIQGEGAVIGYQTVFLRLGGCDYKCARCDSLHAVLPELVKAGSEYLTQQEIFSKVVDYMVMHTADCEWVTISGGNPAIWDLSDLVTALKDVGIKIAVETQGTIWQDWLQDCDMVTVSPKGPGMGEEFKPELFDVFQHNLQHHPGFSVKVVIFQQEDIELAAYLVDEYPHLRPRSFLSIGNVNPPAPAKRNVGNGDIGYDELVKQMLGTYRIFAEDIMRDPRLACYRLLPQLHCLIWGNKQGY